MEATGKLEGRLRGDSEWTPITDYTSLAALEAKYKRAYFKTRYVEDPGGHLFIVNPIGNVVECEYREVMA